MKLLATVFALLFSVEAFAASAADHGAGRSGSLTSPSSRRRISIISSRGSKTFVYSRCSYEWIACTPLRIFLICKT